MGAGGVFIAILASLSSVMATLPEQLFLDLPLAEVANGTVNTPIVQPWASMYCEAVSENRYGDAIYARYNIDGKSANGTFMDTNRTVVEEIELDAINYYSGHPELYEEALLFYSSNSNADGRPEIIELIRSVPKRNVARRDDIM